MSTQSKMINNEYLKLSPNTGYYIISWGIIKNKFPYIEAVELDIEYSEPKRYWISRNLYDRLNNYITVIDGKFKFIYEGKLEDVWYMEFNTNDVIKTSYGNMIKQDLKIDTHCGSYYLYSNYKLPYFFDRIDMTKLTPISELNNIQIN